MIRAGQRSTFPKLLFIENRMKLERLVEGGLLLAAGQTCNSKTGRGDDSPHMHGQALRISAGLGQDFCSTNEPSPLAMVDRRSSLLDELRRQSGVFFDDTEADEEETDTTDDGADDGPRRCVY